MNADARRDCIQRLPPQALKRITLPEIDRQYTLSEIAVITSAGPARALGMSRKGHLGPGADADVTIFDENPGDDLMFRHPRYVIKGGEIVVEEGDICKVVDGREFVVRPACDESIEDYLRPLFERYYTMSFDNYPVEAHRVATAEICDLTAGGQPPGTRT
jgi:formylmethanofuran dehydrogenase subunit A